MTEKENYGTADATYQAMGGYEGVKQLVAEFYAIMDRESEFAVIRDMHPPHRELTLDKLTRFLCAWMGGPRLYNEKYGAISIPGVHAHLSITEREKEQWLGCMHKALQQQQHPQDLIDYLLPQFAIPASRIVAMCSPKNQ